MSDVTQQESRPAAPVDWGRLRQAREARGISLAQVSAHLKLTLRQIEAIERGELSVLPGAAFSRGFVRNYARFLQLDPAPFLAAIDAGEGHEPAALAEQMFTPSLGRMPTPGDARFSALPAGLLVIALAVLLGLGWYFRWFEARDDAALLESPEPPVPEVSAVVASVPPASVEASAAASLPAAGASPVVAPSAVASGTAQSLPAASASAPLAGQSVPGVRASAPAVPVPVMQSQPVRAQSAPLAQAAVAGQSAVAGALPRIVLTFDGDSWVEVRDATGKVVFSRLSQTGVVQEVQGIAPFSLVIGNAPKVRLAWKGRPVDLAPYLKGDVARLTVQ